VTGLVAALLLAGPALPVEHQHPSGAFSFRTPEGWVAGPVEGQPDLFEARGPETFVRFRYEERESGFDSLHVTCMELRLAGPMETEPHVKYEHDFLSGMIGNRRVLDSAFVVGYDKPQRGSSVWRQRNVTVVGEGESLCAISYAPAARWKKSKPLREELDAVLMSVVFKPRP
jgi:hypothetical protein